MFKKGIEMLLKMGAIAPVTTKSTPQVKSTLK
jgi:hypothetical protein